MSSLSAQGATHSQRLAGFLFIILEEKERLLSLQGWNNPQEEPSLMDPFPVKGASSLQGKDS